MSGRDGPRADGSRSVFLDRVRTALRDGGQRPAFVWRGDTITYGAAHDLLLRLHATLAAHGIGPGQLVAMAGGNRPETVLGQLAAQLRGADVLHLAASATDAGRRAALSASGVTALLVTPGREGEACPAAPCPVVRLRPSEPDAEISLPPSVRTVFASGGTTGTPKLIAHRGIYDGMAHVFRPDPAGPHRVLVVAPLAHLTGNCAVLGALLGGDTVVLHDGFDPGAALRAIETERVTHLSLTPPRLAALLDHPARAGTDLSSVRALSTGASRLPAARLRQALDVFGPVVGQGYGLTEAPMVASISAAEYEGHPERLGSVGRIVPGMEARIDDGEVLVRGLALMEGYHRDLAATERAMGDGWLRTGDLGHFDSDGYLYLHGRADDVVVTGEHSTLVHPATVEDAIASHPRVREAAVFGAPGPDGDLLHAAVVGDAALTPHAVREHVRHVLGGDHFVPATVAFPAELPLTPVGKVDRRALAGGPAHR